MTGFDEECSYITEDGKAIFLKCHHTESAGKLFPNYKKSTTSIITSIAEVVDFSYACAM